MENTELQTATQQLLLEINRNHNHQAEATAERENLIDLRDRAEETAEEANRLLASVQSDLANLRATIVPKPAAHPGQVKAFENKSQEINLAVSSIAQQAGQLADTAKTAAQDPQPTPSGPTSSLPPRVYIQIPDGAREVARQLELRLEQRSVGGSKIIVPGIEVVPKPPPEAVLRCFTPQECANDAPKIVDEINGIVADPEVKLQDLSILYKDATKNRPRHYELWLPAKSVKLKAEEMFMSR